MTNPSELTQALAFLAARYGIGYRVEEIFRRARERGWEPAEVQPEVHPSNLTTVIDVLETERDELRRENETLRRNADNACSEAAATARENEAMALTIERMTVELEKPEDVRLREVQQVMQGRAEVFASLADRIDWVLSELDEWIERAGKAERQVDALRKVAEAAREYVRRTDGMHVEDCHAYGADDGDSRGESPDPHCDCGVLEDRDRLRAALAALAALDEVQP